MYPIKAELADGLIALTIARLTGAGFPDPEPEPEPDPELVKVTVVTCAAVPPNVVLALTVAVLATVADVSTAVAIPAEFVIEAAPDNAPALVDQFTPKPAPTGAPEVSVTDAERVVVLVPVAAMEAGLATTLPIFGAKNVTELVARTDGFVSVDAVNVATPAALEVTVVTAIPELFDVTILLDRPPNVELNTTLTPGSG